MTGEAPVACFLSPSLLSVPHGQGTTGEAARESGRPWDLEPNGPA